MIQVAVVDDHPLICEGISQLVAHWQPAEIHTFLDGKKGLEFIRKRQPDIAILDVDLGDMSGLEIAEIIQQESLTTRVIILTLHKDKAYFLRALDYGALGYINKDCLSQEIINCLEAVYQGKQFIGSTAFEDPEEISEYLDAINQTRKQFNLLTQSEKNIVLLICQNFNTKEISEHLFISPRTVDNHRANVCKKLDLKGQNSLLKWTMEHKNVLERMV